MLSYEAGSIVFNRDRCCQCGACLAVCEPMAIQKHIGSDGLMVLQIDQEKCVNCGDCVRVCPAHQLPLVHLDESIWNRVKETGLAWHEDNNIRKKASSGGAARAILAGCLSKKKCDAVYTLIRQPDPPWAGGNLFFKSLDIEKMPNSMYLPIPFLEDLRLNEKIGSLVIAGTTCQLLAATKLLKGKVDNLLRVAILCKQQKKIGFTNFVAKRLSSSAQKAISSVEYRGRGWPGQMTINQLSLCWEQAAAIPFGKRLWRIPGCLFCPNPFGYKPDVTLADPWGLESMQTAGKTMAVAWTDAGRELLHDTPLLRFETQFDTYDIKKSVNWSNLLRKQRLTRFYLGHKVDIPVVMAGLLEKLQTTVLERSLETFRLPESVYKVIAHLPDPIGLIPSSLDEN